MTIAEDLRHTVIAEWHARLADNQSPRRNHWQTKTIYFQATEQLLNAPLPQPLNWKRIVAAARPHGCRSTFYEVAGSRARHGMVSALIADGRVDSIQIALRYQRQDPVEQLIDETKVWSYWPYRQNLLNRLHTEEMTADAMEDLLTGTVLTWARSNGSLAAANNRCPPACAVEDLTVLRNGQLAATRAASRLTDSLRRAATAG